MKSQLTRELIEGLNNSNNQEFLDNLNEFVFNLVSNAVVDIAGRSPFITPEKCILLPVNENFTGAISQLSEYTYFLGVDNPQIEFNSKMKRNFWKNAWREFRAAWRLGKKKYRKEKKEAKTVNNGIDKYKLSDFKHDLVHRCADYLSETSIVYEYSDHISMIGIDDFGTGVRINIYPCVYDFNKKQFKMYNQNKNKFFIVDFGNRMTNLEQKSRMCGDMFVNMIRIFNALYSKAYNKIPNQILVESLIYNCPNVLFDESDLYKTFVNVANYICLSAPQTFLSVCDSTKTIFEDPLITKTSAQLDFPKIVNALEKFEY